MTAVEERTVQRRFQKLRSGDMNMEHEPRGHAAPIIKSNELRTLFLFNPRQTVSDVEEQEGVNLPFFLTW